MFEKKRKKVALRGDWRKINLLSMAGGVRKRSGTPHEKNATGRESMVMRTHENSGTP